MIVGGVPLLLIRSAFDPEDLYELGEYGSLYVPSDLSTLWQDTAGTTPVTASGQSVARIDDKTANGIYLTQSEPNFRPIYTESAALRYLDFDGTDDYLISSSTLSQTIMDSVNGGSICVAAGKDTATLGGILAEFIDDATDNKQVTQYYDGRTTPNRHSNYAADGTNRDINLSGQLSGVHTLFHISDGSNSVGYVDNAAVGSSVSSTSNFAAATKIVMGVHFNAGMYHDGPFYGGLIINRQLTSSERSHLNAWLSDKAGL